MFGDTLISGTTSKCENKYEEVFAANFGWTRTFPMKSKSEAYGALSLIFLIDDVPPQIIVDGPKDQVETDFSRKCKDAA